ncbi:pilus assembly protein [Paenibacillus sp. P96]|uniref:Pilus assembly protein n=1 Tax=Paenibacillus zeirhizosphaerae TaxID=2987519 RepID=A0ABT9FVW6_9BACL|nr:TadE/TadG family type IV pilus assembly protein [Paenibacillus sp. P96]MDP4098871.1 pilus assembly protein [Paenibacillus sp. P96]
MIEPLQKEEEGSFSLEASLVMPVILLLIFVLLFFCIYLYQKTILVQLASTASERSAYNWDNSHKHPVNGAFAQGERDSLYWRLKDDAALGALFGWAGAENEVKISISGAAGEDGPLTVQKMQQAAEGLPSELNGEMSYRNSLIKRTITTELENMAKIPLLNSIMTKPEMKSSIWTSIVDPVEFIRTVDLLGYYGAKFSGRGGGARVTPAAAGNVLQQYGQSGM